MNIVDFNEERYRENKAIADELLDLIKLFDNGVYPHTKKSVHEQLSRLEWKYRQKAFTYRNKI